MAIAHLGRKLAEWLQLGNAGHGERKALIAGLKVHLDGAKALLETGDLPVDGAQLLSELAQVNSDLTKNGDER